MHMWLFKELQKMFPTSKMFLYGTVQYVPTNQMRQAVVNCSVLNHIHVEDEQLGLAKLQLHALVPISITGCEGEHLQPSADK